MASVNGICDWMKKLESCPTPFGPQRKLDYTMPHGYSNTVPKTYDFIIRSLLYPSEKERPCEQQMDARNWFDLSALRPAGAGCAARPGRIRTV